MSADWLELLEESDRLVTVSRAEGAVRLDLTGPMSGEDHALIRTARDGQIEADRALAERRTPEALAAFGDAMRLFILANERDSAGRCAWGLAHANRLDGNWQQVVEWARSSAHAFLIVDDEVWRSNAFELVATGCCGLADQARATDVTAAHRLYDLAHRVYLLLGDAHGQGRSAWGIAETSIDLGELPRAGEALEVASAHLRADDSWTERLTRSLARLTSAMDPTATTWRKLYALEDRVTRPIRSAAAFSRAMTGPVPTPVPSESLRAACVTLSEEADATLDRGEPGTARGIYLSAAEAYLDLDDWHGAARSAWGLALCHAAEREWNAMLGWGHLGAHVFAMLNDDEWLRKALLTEANALCGVGDSTVDTEPGLAAGAYEAANRIYLLDGDMAAVGRSAFGWARSLLGAGDLVRAARQLDVARAHLDGDHGWEAAIDLQLRAILSAVEARGVEGELATVLEGLGSGANPDVRLRAFTMLAIGRQGSAQADMYRTAVVGASGDASAREVVLRCFRLSQADLADVATEAMHRALAADRSDSEGEQLHVALAYHYRSLSEHLLASNHFLQAADLANDEEAKRYRGLAEYEQSTEAIASGAAQGRIRISAVHSIEQCDDLERAARSTTGHLKTENFVNAALICMRVDPGRSHRLLDEGLAAAVESGCEGCESLTWVTRGDVFDSAGDIGRARQAWRQVLLFDDVIYVERTVEALCNLGRSYLVTGDLDDAQAVLTSALARIGPSPTLHRASINTHWLAAQVARRHGVPDRALGHVDEAIRLDALLRGRHLLRRIKLLIERGHILLRLGRLADAVEAADTAIAEGTSLEEPGVLAQGHLLRAHVGMRDRWPPTFVEHDARRALEFAKQGEDWDPIEEASQILGIVLTEDLDEDGPEWLAWASAIRAVLRLRVTDPEVREAVARAQQVDVHNALVLCRMRHRDEIGACVLESDRITLAAELLLQGAHPDLASAYSSALLPSSDPDGDAAFPRAGDGHAAGFDALRAEIGDRFVSRAGAVGTVDPRGLDVDHVLSYHLLLPGRTRDTWEIAVAWWDREQGWTLEMRTCDDATAAMLQDFVDAGHDGVTPGALRRPHGDDWEAVSALLIPDRLRLAIRRAAESGQVLRLLVCPSGPLWGLPWPALPTAGEGLVLDGAQLTFAPSVSAAASVGRRLPTRGERVVCVAGPALQDSRTLSETISQAFPPTLFTSATSSAQAAEALSTGGVRTLVVLAHGDSSDGLDQALDVGPNDKVSARDLMGWQLPLDVRLAACASGFSRWTPGREPLGLVTAAHFAGARWVTAFAWPVAEVALARLCAAMGDGEDPAAAVRRAQLHVRANHRDLPLSEWATLMVHGQ